MKGIEMRTAFPALAVLTLLLAGCSANDPSSNEAAAPSASTSSPSATATSPSPTRSPSATRTPSATPTPNASPEPEVTEAPAADTDGYQRPEPDANGVVGPSEEYYDYDGYVAPGFEYQVGSQCFDPALGRCKSSGEIQAEHMEGLPPAGQLTYDEAYAAWQGGMPYKEAFCVNYTPVTQGGISQCEGIKAGTVDAITGEYLGDGPASGGIPGPGYELRNGCYYKPGTEEVVGCY